MIIIIEHCPMKKGKKRKGQRSLNKKGGQRSPSKKGAMLLSLFPHLCFKVAPCSSCSESHILCFKVAPHSSCSESHILCFKVAPCFSYSVSHKLYFHTCGNFSLYNLACIFIRWASSNALGLHEQASWMHTH